MACNTVSLCKSSEFFRDRTGFLEVQLNALSIHIASPE